VSAEPGGYTSCYSSITGKRPQLQSRSFQRRSAIDFDCFPIDFWYESVQNPHRGARFAVNGTSLLVLIIVNKGFMADCTNHT